MIIIKKERAAEVPHLSAAARDDLLALHEFPYCFAYFFLFVCFSV
jgi:hypothetical protein